MDVLIDEHFVTEKWQGISVRKSLCQDRVYIKNDAGVWKQAGILGHASKCISGIAGFPKELGQELADACSKQKCFKVTFAGSPELAEEVVEELEEDYDE